MLNVLRRSSCLLAITAVLYACGDATSKPRDFGQPPDAGAFDPGRGGGGDGYGSGGAQPGDGGVLPPPVCPDDLKRCSVEVTLAAGNETKVELRGDWDAPDSWEKGLLMTKSGALWKVTAPFAPGKGVMYKFCIDPNAQGQCASWKVDPTKPVSGSPPTDNNVLATVACAETVCVDPPALPVGVFDWRDAVIYFPMVDRFLDGDASNPCRVNDGRVAELANYQGGDWKGITRKITEGYFAELGVNTLWLSVTAENARGPDEGVGGNAGKWFTGYHAYWPKDLNPATPYSCFGTAADLKQLVDTAHAAGMKIITDYAMVHVHVSSPLYADHKDWFWTINNGPYTTCANDLWEVFSESGGNVFWDPNREGNKCWFTPMLAHWNFTNVTARNYVVDNVIDWIQEYAFDGLRLDAVKHVDMQWLKDVRARVTSDIMPTKKAGERFYLLGETYDGDARKLKVHVDPATMLDGQFDFALQPTVQNVILRRQGTMTDLANAVATSEGFYGSRVVMSTFVGNHDQDRAIGAAGGANAPGYERLANAFGALLTVKGAPSILYGDEIGMPGGADPENRGVMTFTGWSADQQKLRGTIAKLSKIRGEHPALRRGSRTTLALTNDVWAFEMKTTGDVVYVAINRGDADVSATGLPSGSLRELVGSTTVSGPSVVIPARSTRVFVKN